MFFGSLSNSVVRNCLEPVLVIYPSGKNPTHPAYRRKRLLLTRYFYSSHG
jgi:hypothetical protein